MRLNRQLIAALVELAIACAASASAESPRSPPAALLTDAPAHHLALSPAAAFVRRQRLINFDETALEAIASTPSVQFNFNLFDDAQFVGVVTRIENRAADRFTCTGILRGDEAGWFVIAREADAVVATLWTAHNRTFQIRPRQNGDHIAQQIDSEKLGGCANETSKRPNVQTSKINASPGRVAPIDGGMKSTVGTTSCDQAIDVLVLYTPRLRNALGSDHAARALAYASVASANIAHENSSVAARMRLVHVALTNYTEGPELTDDIIRLQSNGDGFMDEVFALRSQHGADLVSLLVDSFSNSCGIAYVMSPPSSSFGSVAFSVVQQNCALANLTFAHELAHNLGCNHDWSDPSAGAFPYSHGLRFTGSSGENWRTVMAGTPGTRIPFFSNPNILFDGVATGIAEGQPNPADNARTINNTAALAGAFFPANFRDCNNNRVADECDILSGASLDENENGVPDECDPPACAAATLAKLAAFDALSFDRFGGSVSMCDDRVVVGSMMDDDAGSMTGSAYVFRRLDQHTWVHEAKLVASDAHAFHHFGRSVALSPQGNYIIVGAYRDGFEISDAGAVYIFKRAGMVWREQDKIINPDPEQSDWFGWSVAWAGDESGELFAVIGAPFDNEAASDAGAAYVVGRADDGWSAPVKLTANDAPAGAWMGYSVAGALQGDRFIAGAPSADNAKTIRSGAAYVFSRNGETWTQESRLAANVPLEQARLGWSVGVSGETALAGAINDSERGERSGAAIVFQPENGNWIQRQKLFAADAGPSKQFGAAVGLRDDVALIGSILDVVAGSPSGSAFVFRRTNSSWVQQSKIAAPDGAPYDNFGVAAALAPRADLAVAGAYFDDHHATVDGGSASILALSGPTPICCPADVHGPDGAVNVNDLLAVINHWGACATSCPIAPCAGDVNGDCTVNVSDLLEIITNWGPCP